MLKLFVLYGTMYRELNAFSGMEPFNYLQIEKLNITDSTNTRQLHTRQTKIIDARSLHSLTLIICMILTHSTHM